MSADLILTNGKIRTFSSTKSIVSALAILDGRVLAAGTSAEIGELRGPGTEVIDLEGRTVIPGLTDSHAHLVYYGLSTLRANLSDSRSVEEIIHRLKAHAEKSYSDWILGSGFDQELLAERRFPTREDLDRVSLERPVLISRLCGHACVVNSRAIELAGPERLPVSGRLTGLLTENDMGPVWDRVPDPSPKQTEEALLVAANKARSTGITSVHCLIDSMDDLEVLRRLHSSNSLPVRMYVQVSYGIFAKLAEEGLRTGAGDDMLRIGSVKIFADGSMGARTAALSEDFADDPGNRGILLHSDEDLTEMVRKANASGWQAAIHAIGDKAIEQAVNAIEAVLMEAQQDNEARRHRIEHASILTESLIERMAHLRILAAVQPQFIITDFWTIDRVGPERYRWAYPFRAMMEAGVPLSFGSDCPVETLDAFELIHRAVTRDEYSPGERLSVEEAVGIYALGGPFAAFEEDRRGSLEPGRLADLVVLDRDIFDIPPEEIPHCNAEWSMVQGQWSMADG